MSVRRGRVPVGAGSWHWRWYNQWRSIKGREKTERSQVDLCHYMRVLLIFAPWRWFWQGYLRRDSRVFDAPPFVYVLLLACLGAAVFAFVAFPAGSLVVLAAIGVAFATAASLFGIGYAIRRWYVKDTDAADAFLQRLASRVETFVYYAFFPIWWPVYWLVRGVKRAGIAVGHGFYRFGEFLFTKRLFSFSAGGELVTVSPMGILIPAAMVFAIVNAIVFHPFVFGLVCGSIVGAALLVFVIVRLVMRIRRWSKENASKPPVEPLPAKPKKEHETAQLVWSWLVAKKHRVCPLIEPQEGR